MKLDRLTQKAKDFIMSLPQVKVLTVGQILTTINQTSTVGTHLLKLIPEAKLDVKKKVNVNSLVKEAFYHALKMEHSYVGTEHFLLALFKLSGAPDYQKLKTEMEKISLFPHTLKTTEKAKKTPLMESFSHNITYKVLRDFNRPILFRDEYNTMLSVLLQRHNNNVLLVGDPGVGKTSLIEMFARNLNTLDVPTSLIGYQVYEFDLLAFMTYLFNRGAPDLGISSLVEEIKSLGRVILSIKNFQNVFFATNMGFTIPVFYSLLKSTFESNGVRMIGCMNLSLYDKIVAENDQAFDNFSVVEVDEPDEELTLRILELNSEYLGNFHNISVNKDLVKAIYKKAKDKLKEEKFPQKGLNLLDQACARLVMKKNRVPQDYKSLVDKTYFYAQGIDKSISKGDFENALKMRDQLKALEKKLFTKETRIISPQKLALTETDVEEALRELEIEVTSKVKDRKLDTLTKLAPAIKKQIIGQDHAVDIVVKSLIRSRLGLRTKKRPMGNFLFLGPTGVGKTQLAKVLADEAFGPGSLIRLDMSDFSEKHTVARLVGAPPGYVGYGEGGELTQKIETKPESVVLFDEIEKAHPDVLNILLQIMEEGELTDAKGNTFDFSKAVVILTSNLGTDILHKAGIGFDGPDLSDTKVEERLKLNLKKIMKPELINRFDELIVFRRLKKDSLNQILEIILEEIKGILVKQAVFFHINKGTKEHLLKLGTSDEYGARSLRRVIEKEIVDRVAEGLIQNRERPLRIKFGFTKDHLTVKLS